MPHPQFSAPENEEKPRVGPVRSFGWAQPHVASDMASVCVCV